MDTREPGWVVPSAWWRKSEAVHGRTPVPKRVRGKSKVGIDFDDFVARGAVGFRAVIEHESTPVEVRTAGVEFLDSDRPPSTLASAAAWTVMTDQPYFSMREPFISVLVERYGPSYAAEVAVLAAGLRFQYHRDPRGPQYAASVSLEMRESSDVLNVWIFEPHSLIRSALAALPEAEYREAVHRLAGLRGLTMAQNIMTSFLCPTEKRWWQDDLEYVASLSYDFNRVHYFLALLSCVDNSQDVETVFGLSETRDHALWMIGQRLNFLYSMAVNVGPGAEPYLGELFEGNVSAQNKKRLVAMLAEFDTDEGFMQLLTRADKKYVEPALLQAMALDPGRATRLLPDASGLVAERLLREHRVLYPIDGAEHEVSSVHDDGVRVVLPTVLVTPPWTRGEAVDEPNVMGSGPRARPLTLDWAPGELDRFRTFGDPYVPWVGHNWSWSARVAVIEADGYGALETLAYAPEGLVRPLLGSIRVPRWVWHPERDLSRILGRFELAAVEFVVEVVVARPAHAAQVLLPVDGTRVVESMMRWSTTKTLRPTALSWFDRHIGTAAVDLVDTVVGPVGASRRSARRLLRELDRRGHRSKILDVAQQRSSAVADAVTVLLDADPLLELPVVMPTLPPWVEPALLPPVTTIDGDQLPGPEIINLSLMLALSRMDDVYAGLDIVRATVEVRSLEQFVWGLFERWQRAGHPEPQDWVLDALAITGGDEVVRALTPVLLRWPLQSAHRRAEVGLAVLAEIGTDAALGALWRIAQGLRFPALTAKAEAHIERIADELGLTANELADRLVPDFGFDADGSLDFDYGDLIFTVKLDSMLRLVVFDQDGAVRKSLPRTGSAAPDLAREKYKEFLRLRKELAPVGAELIDRFERAMITQRLWPMSQVRVHLLTQPLMWSVCRSLIWFKDDGREFRFTDLRTPVDLHGEHIEIDDVTKVGIVHPAVRARALDSWKAIIREHIGVQSFDQAERTVLHEELAAVLSRYKDKKTATRNLLALTGRGWKREAPQDKGAQIALNKYRGDEIVASILVFPGFNVANPVQWNQQRIVDVMVHPDGLGRIEESELARDLMSVPVTQIVGDEPDLEGFDSI